jgi:HK97 gp10 family phage protein
MGKFDFEMDSGLVRRLERLENFDEIAEEMLNEAVPILEREVKNECLRHVRTKDMYHSVKKTKAFKNQYGWFVTVRPTGTDRKGVRNMEKMAHAEYGTSKQAPTPILTKALNDARNEVESKLEDIFIREIEKK